MQIKLHSKVKHLGCLIDKTMSREAMTCSITNKINNKLFSKTSPQKCTHVPNV